MQRVGHHRDCAGFSGIRLADRELSAAVSMLQLWHHCYNCGIIPALPPQYVMQHQCSSNSAAASAVPLSVL